MNEQSKQGFDISKDLERKDAELKEQVELSKNLKAKLEEASKSLEGNAQMIMYLNK